MDPKEIAADYLDRGYVEETTFQNLHVGQRVHHSGQRYAYGGTGTATIERIFVNRNSAWAQNYGRPDVELIVRRDDATPGFWADYHTVVAS